MILLVFASLGVVVLLLSRLSVPPLIVVVPEKVFAPVSVNVPVPALIKLLAVVPFEMTPPTVSVFAFVVIVRLVPAVVPRDTAPVPRFRFCVPVNVKSPFQTWALLVESVIADPVVLSIVPPAMVNVPGPSALALFIFRVPALRVVPPV